MTSLRNHVAARIAARRLRGCKHSDGTCARCLADAVLAPRECPCYLHRHPPIEPCACICECADHMGVDQ